MVRLDPADLEALQVQIGDILEVAGKRRTVAKAMPAYKEHRGQSRIHMDGLIRANAEAGLGEYAQVRKTSALPAESVILVPGAVLWLARI